jgi:hypothetical protein
MRIAVACALIAGCSDTPTLAIQLATQPSAISFRPDRGEWTTVPQIAESLRLATYELPEVDGTIAIACKRADGSFQVEELSATAAELTSELYAPVVPWPQLDCAPPTGSALVQITGSAVGGAQLYIGDQMIQLDESSSFVTETTIGVHDVVVANNEYVLIRHDQPMLMPYIEPTIDVQAQGSAISTMNLADSVGDGFQLTTFLVTVNGTQAQLPRSPDSIAFFVPAELLAPGDTQVVAIDEGTDTQFGSTDSFFSAAFVDPNLFTTSLVGTLDPPAGATFGSDVSVDFSDADLDPMLTDYRVEYSTQEGSLAATATAGWIASHGDNVVFDSSFPDFAWPIGTDAEREFTIAQRGSAILLEATMADP